jgi:type IV pilus assembly protein PilY1
MSDKGLSRLAAVLFAIAAGAVSAAPVDLATTPMVSGVTRSVAPNVQFIMDDSTSMNWEFMPDGAWAKATSNCFKNYGYNRIYYNPNVTYSAPKKADGTSHPNSSFTSAWVNGYNTSAGTVNLSSKFQAYGSGDSRGSASRDGPDDADSEQAAYYYKHTNSPTSPPTACENNNRYTKVTVAAAERQNFANWYSYYRTRLLTMKTSAGRAFANVDPSYRVGYHAISEDDPKVSSSKFLKPAAFTSTHKSDWYTKLYSAGCKAGGSCTTPLRGALSKTGQLFAGKVLTGNDDPVQYSCQQNFSILTTDGYWNTSDESKAYGPKKEDNSSNVGDQDGVAGTARPYLDSGKYANSLADIAMYYYTTDLRPTGSTGGLNEEGSRTDVSLDNVPTAGADTARWQHMTTFTLGLGVSGTLAYNESYLTGGSADYNAILQGTKHWPDPQTSSDDSQVRARIDDLWHTAVNGRGQYLSAASPDALVSALTKALTAIAVTNGSAAAAATSSLEPVAGDNFAYVAQYTSALWYGDLYAREIDLATGALGATATWSARTKLASRVEATKDTREIFTFSGAATNKLRAFTAANLTAEINANHFRSDATNPNGALTQSATWLQAQKDGATASAMIDFLRGQTGHEDESANTLRLFRDRTSALGDIVNAAPVYVRRPPFKYADKDYAAFVNDQKNRKGTVYVGANDGMLHAFDADTGAERWAYVPTAVIPMLYKLADSAYANNHRFYVDGPLTVGDVYDGSSWHTVLIGGLGRGGRAYFAIDITDPDKPRGLWEFGTAEDADLGYTYGNPLITKRESDGRWVVAFASGYNNTLGDSKGRLYVVDALTGARLDEIITDNAVTDPSLSGISRIVGWVPDTLVSNSTQYVYGGDLAGNLWRFDLTSSRSQVLGHTSATAGAQPITVRPELGRVRDGAGSYHRVIFFGTGRYLGFGDLEDDTLASKSAQAIYAVKDTDGDLGLLGDPDTLVEQTLDTSKSPRTIPNPVPVEWSTHDGWYVEMPVGERINVDPRLQLGTIVAVANQPSESGCEVGGKSVMYALDYRTGAAVITQSDRSVGFPVGNSLATGLTLVRLPSDKLIAIITQADANVRPLTVPVAPGAGADVRRVGWRELF